MGLTRQEFLEYIKAFNDRDYEKQYSYYHDDVTLDIPDPQTGILYGKEGIKGHYLPLFNVAEEVLVPMVIMVDGDKIFYLMESYFLYRQKVDKAVFGYRVQPGDIIKIESWAYYQLVDGKMKKIVCNVRKNQCLGKVDLKEYLRESESRAETDLRIINYSRY